MDNRRTTNTTKVNRARIRNSRALTQLHLRPIRLTLSKGTEPLLLATTISMVNNHMIRIAVTRPIPHSHHLTVDHLSKATVIRGTHRSINPKVSTVSLEPQEPQVALVALVARRAIAVSDQPCSAVLAAPLLDTKWEEAFLVPWAAWSLVL